MPASFKSSERVRLESQERFDLPDALGLQQLVDEAVQRHFGGLLGQGSGLVSPFKYTWNAQTKTVTFGPFQYYLASPKTLMTDDGGATWKGWNGGFFDFTPGTSGQAAEWDFSAPFAAAVAGDANGAYCSIYARPIVIDEDTDGRRRWQGGAEASVALLTRTRLRTEIKTVPSSELVDESSEDGWSLVGFITAWSGGIGNAAPGTPTLSPSSFFNGRERAINLPGILSSTWAGTGSISVNSLLQVLAGSGATSAFLNTSSSKDVGLLQLLSVVRNRLQVLGDTTLVRSWLDTPKSTDGALVGGFKQLWDVLQPRLARPISGSAASVTFFNNAYSLEANAFNVQNLVHSNVGRVLMEVTTVPAGYMPMWATAHSAIGQASRFIGCDVILDGGVYKVRCEMFDAAGAFAEGSFSVVVFFRKV